LTPDTAETGSKKPVKVADVNRAAARPAADD
jgi:hypothetical protein